MLFERDIFITPLGEQTEHFGDRLDLIVECWGYDSSLPELLEMVTRGFTEVCPPLWRGDWGLVLYGEERSFTWSILFGELICCEFFN